MILIVTEVTCQPFVDDGSATKNVLMNHAIQNIVLSFRLVAVLNLAFVNAFSSAGLKAPFIQLSITDSRVPSPFPLFRKSLEQTQCQQQLDYF